MYNRFMFQVNIDNRPREPGFTHVKKGHPPFTEAVLKMFYIFGQCVNH